MVIIDPILQCALSKFIFLQTLFHYQHICSINMSILWWPCETMWRSINQCFLAQLLELLTKYCTLVDKYFNYSPKPIEYHIYNHISITLIIVIQ
jgi:hypothetical protein